MYWGAGFPSATAESPCPASRPGLHVELGPIDALPVTFHAVLLAGRAPRDDAPAIRMGFAKGLPPLPDSAGMSFDFGVSTMIAPSVVIAAE